MHLDQAHLVEVCRILEFWAPGVQAFAFGSRATGRNLKPTSDLDICLRGPSPLDRPILRHVRDAFDVSDLPMRVDVVDWCDLESDFRDRIQADFVEIGSSQTVLQEA